MNVTGCYIFFKRMTSVCNTNMRPLWCQKNESIGKMKTKKRVLCLLSIWMCTMGAAFADEHLENGLRVRKQEMPSLPYFRMRILVLVLSIMTEGLIWTVPTLAISMLCLMDCS